MVHKDYKYDDDTHYSKENGLCLKSKVADL